MNLSEAKKLRYSIIGAGRSGIAIAKFLKSIGASVFLSESSKEKDLLYFSPEEFKKLQIDFEVGEHTKKVFESDIIIVSPGVPLNSEVVLKANSSGKRVYGEIEVASWFCKAPIIAITGTNGKTTTTALTGEIFKTYGFNAIVCGNIGNPFASVLDKIKEDSIIILEISSFQLMSTETFKPEVAAILNIAEDHLDWHGSFDNYVNAKFLINKNQVEKDYFIYNSDDTVLSYIIKSKRINGNICAFGSFDKVKNLNFKHLCYIKDEEVRYSTDISGVDEKIIDIKNINIPGRHNVYNSMAAILAAKCFGIDNSAIAHTLKTFKGVEHRIEFVKEINGVKYYNDSKSTNFDSLYVALESFPGNIILIMGGKKGDNKFQMVDNLIKERVTAIYAIGESKDAIYKHYKDILKVTMCDTLQEAVKNSSRFAKSGDVVLFSPGYKSFDMFNNYEHRGNEFKKSVNQL
ncbi:MAG: UDP-N-acetylmuramoyl-L-alanine--D-glutamate ligase [Ignavibacteria bacterium]|nr:UDP-N-acetylmuramoyl-L-alanine--D-glutamate ligase [Ignavibacteria bacterium]